MNIVGAGLTGLIAAHIWPTAQLFELSPVPSASHQALLRFRSDAVSNRVGIEFRRVLVRKGIWYAGAFRPPDIHLANAYSRKCLDAILPERSIWNLDPVERYIAPENLYAQLIDACGSRIHWNVDYWLCPGIVVGVPEPTISTAPLPFTLDSLFPGEIDTRKFLRAPILVQRFRVPRCEAYQTVYFPDESHTVYRASITGSLLIVEHAGDAPTGQWLTEVFEAFNISDQIEPLSSIRQTFGKIAPYADDAERKALLFRLTRERNVFSLGRFACWRNTLLDDVISDSAVIKRLILSNSHYEGFKA